MRILRLRFTLRCAMIAVVLVAALLGAFEAGRRWERDHGRRGFLKVRAGRHLQSWELDVPAYPTEIGVSR